MKAITISLGGALLLAGCTISSEEDQLENSIRENLSARGNVQDVQLTKQDDDNLSGFAVVRLPTGIEGRLDCTARRTEGTNFSWRCVPSIDEALLTQIEGTIRQTLADQGTVLAVEMTRRDADSMTGYAQIRDTAGNEGRLSCTATRETGEAGNFDWECAPPGREAPAGAPANAGGE